MIKHYIIQAQACWKFVHIFSACRSMQFWSGLLSMWPFPLARFSYIAKFIMWSHWFRFRVFNIVFDIFLRAFGNLHRYTKTTHRLQAAKYRGSVIGGSPGNPILLRARRCPRNGKKRWLFKCWEGHGCKILDYFECNSLEHECLNMVFFSC